MKTVKHPDNIDMWNNPNMEGINLNIATPKHLKGIMDAVKNLFRI